MSKYARITEEEENWILSEDYSLNELAEMIGKPVRSLRRKAKQLGVKLRASKLKEYEIFFDEIDENSAYVLGFIAADGWILDNYGKGTNRLTIELAKKDLDTLYKIVDLMQIPRQKIKEVKCHINSFAPGKIQVKLEVHSKYLIQALKEYNITPRKSLTLQFPTNIPFEYTADYMRGYFDGDGSFYEIDQLSGNRLTSNIVLNSEIPGTLDFLKVFLNLFKELTDCEEGSIQKKKNIYYIKFGYRASVLLGDLMYENEESVTYMKRKYDVYKPFKKSK